MQTKDFYSTAHIVVSAIRVLVHQKKMPPSTKAVCEMLSFSLEQGHRIFRKLGKMGIIEVVEGAFGTKIFIRDHLKIEKIPKVGQENTLKQEIEKFQNNRKGLKQKIESIQTEKAEKQKQLFAELENKLKRKLDNK